MTPQHEQVASPNPKPGKKLGLRKETVRNLMLQKHAAAWPCGTSEEASEYCDSADCPPETEIG